MDEILIAVDKGSAAGVRPPPHRESIDARGSSLFAVYGVIRWSIELNDLCGSLRGNPCWFFVYSGMLGFFSFVCLLRGLSYRSFKRAQRRVGRDKKREVTVYKLGN